MNWLTIGINTVLLTGDQIIQMQNQFQWAIQKSLSIVARLSPNTGTTLDHGTVAEHNFCHMGS